MNNIFRTLAQIDNISKLLLFHYKCLRSVSLSMASFFYAVDRIISICFMIVNHYLKKAIVCCLYYKHVTIVNYAPNSVAFALISS